MKSTFYTLLFTLMVLFCAFTMDATAQIPKTINYQGALALPNNDPVPDAQYNVTFRMYDSETNGNELWAEQQTVVTFQGVFDAILGNKTLLNLAFDKPYWLSVQIEGQQEMTPRVPLVSVPFALSALKAINADSATYATKALLSDSASVAGHSRTSDTALIANEISDNAKNVVLSLNNLQGRISILGEGGTTVSTVGNTLRISSTSTGITTITSTDGSIKVTLTSTGADVEIADGSIGTTKIQNGAITSNKLATGVIPTSLPPSGSADGDLTGSYPNPTLAPKGAANGQVLKWTGTAWQPANDDGQIYNAGGGISINGSTISNTGDTDPNNDITTATTAGGDLSGTYPAPALAQKGAINGQVLKWNGTSWQPDNDNGQVYNAGRGISINGALILNTGDADSTNDVTITSTAGGDVSGVFNNLKVEKIQNVNVSSTTPTNGQLLQFNATTNSWEPVTINTGSSGVAGGDLAGTYPNPTIAQKGASNGQVLGWNGSAWIPVTPQTSGSAGGDLTGTYPNPTLAQKGATNNQVLKWNGTSWQPANDDGQTYTAGTGINITAGVVTNTGDTDASNDITNSTTASGDLTGTYPAPTIAQKGATNGQVLKWNGTAWTPSTDNGDVYTAGDAINITAGAIGVTDGSITTAKLATNAVTTAKITDANVTTPKLADGSVTSAKLNQMSATNGQVLKWNGTAWTPSTDNGDVYTAGDAINITAGAIGVTDGSITTAKLANNAVTTAKITDANVTTPKLADGSVTSAKLNQMSATSGQVLKWNGTAWTPSTDNGDVYTAGDAINITAGAIGVTDGSITTAKLATNAVTTAKITDANVTTPKLADGSVTSAKLNQMSATSGQVLKWNGTAWTPSTDNGDVYTAGDAINISAGAIGVTDGSITTAKLATNAVTTVKITDANVTTSKLADGSVTSAKLNQMSATSGQVLKWNGTAWTPSTDNGDVYTAGDAINITAGAIGVTDGSITTAKLATNAVTTAKITDANVTTPKLADGSVTSAKLNQMSATTGQSLVWNGTAWAPTTVSTSGTAGGDLSGTYPNPNVVKLQTRDVSSTAPTSGQVLKWNGTAWTPSTDNGDVYTAGDAINITAGAIGVTDGSITTAKLATNAVTTAKITDANVTTSKLADGSVTSAKLNQMSATNGQVLKWNGTAWTPSTDNGDVYTAGDAINITAGAIGVTDGSITTAKLATNAVTTAKITDANVTTPKLADGSVTSAKLNQMSATNGQVLKWNGTAWTPSTDNGDVYTAGDAINITAGAIGVTDGSITTAKLATNAVTTAKITDANVTTPKLADGSVTSAKLNQMSATSGQVLKWNGTAWTPSTDNGDVYTAGDAINITAGAIGVTDGSITTAKLATNAVTTAKITDANVTTPKLADGSVTSAKLNQMSATNGQVLKWNGTAWTPSTDNGDVYTAGDAINITAGAIGVTDGSITTAKLANNAVTTVKITDANVTTPKLADGSVTSAKLNQMSATNGQVLKWNGTAWTPSTDNGDVYTAGDAINITAGAIGVTDGSITTAKLANNAVTTAKITDGSVTSSKLHQMSATSGQSLVWNGTAWTPTTVTTSGTAGGDLSGTYPNPNVVRIQNRDVSGAAPTSGQTLVWSGAAWIPSTITASGAAGGDLSGTYPNPNVVKLQTRDISSTAPTTGQALVWNGTAWAPSAVSISGSAGGDLTGTYPNPSVAVNAITTAKILDGNVTTTKLADGSVTSAKLNQMSATTGQALVWNGTSWTPSTVSASGTAGGDLSGTYPNPSVVRIQNRDVSGAAPTSGQTLVWSGTAWIPSTITASGAAGGDLSGTYPNPNVVKLQNRTVASTAPTNGQVLKWNNTTSQWEPSTDAGGSGDVITLGTVADNQLTRYHNTSGDTIQSSAIVIDDYTTSTQNNVTIKADDGSTANISLVLAPKGNGALIADKPDGAATGGNARGINAVDLQIARISATQVASGDYSALVGGYRNTASSLYAVALGGSDNIVDNPYGVTLGGADNVVNGVSSGGIILGGSNNTSTGGIIIDAYGSTTMPGSTVLGGGLLKLNNVGILAYHRPFTASDTVTLVQAGVAYFGNTDFWLGNTKNSASSIRFYESQSTTGAFPASGTNYTALKAGTQTADITWTLPGTTPSTNQVLTATGVSGNNVTLGWSTPSNATGDVVTLGTVTDNQLTRYHNATGDTVQGSAIVIDDLEAPPINTVAIRADNGSTANITLALVPKGNGALVVNKPDGTATGGNPRGQWAVDMQLLRSSSSEVASGQNSTIAGGQVNTASGQNSTVGGGSINTASGANSVIPGGALNTASGSGSTVTGGLTNVSGGFVSTVGGYWNNSTADFSSVPGGYRLRFGSLADGSFGFNGGTNPSSPDSVFINEPKTAYFGNVDLWLGNTDNTASELKFFEAQAADGDFPAAGTNYTAFKAGVQSADVTYTLPTAAPTTNGQVLSSSTAGVMSWSNPSSFSVSNIDGFFAWQDSTAPNSVRFNSILKANGTATDIDAVFSPKGAGAFTLDAANGNIFGGNKRGFNAVDLQHSRTVANQIASGMYSAILSGNDNKADTLYSTVVNGYSNSNMGLYSTIVNGYGNTINQNIRHDLITSGTGNAILKPINPSIYTYSASLGVLPDNYSTILNGVNNQLRSYGSLIGSGIANQIYNDFYGVILTGTSCYVSGLYDAFIGTGQFDSTRSSQTFIGSGILQKIDTLSNAAFIGAGGGMNIGFNSGNSFIGAGNTLSIGNGSGNSFIGAGNTLSIGIGSSYSFIGSGITQSIGNTSTYSFIGAGALHSIKKSSPYSFIGSGYSNTIDTTAEGAVIVGGYQNTIARTKNTGYSQNWNYSAIITGYGNRTYGWLNFIGAGWTDTISTIGYSTILSGNLNKIDAVNDQYDYIGNGYNNKISNASYSNILNGYNHLITVDFSTIGSGYNDTLVGQHSAILAGHENYLSMSGGFIASGAGNKGRAFNATILNGNSNTIDSLSHFGFIANGQGNNIDNDVTYSTITSGYFNSIAANGFTFVSGNETTNDFNIIGTGYGNSLKGIYSTITNGQSNVMDSVGYSIIGTGYANRIKFQTGGSFAHYSMIGAGELNLLQGHYGFMGAGYADTIIGDYNTIVNSRFSSINTVTYSGIVSGYNHTIGGDYSFVGGGNTNTISADTSVIAGGNRNTISSIHGFIGGGADNTISGTYSVIGGGTGNSTSAIYNTIAGGYQNSTANSDATVGGGYRNYASGFASVVAGGYIDTASGLYSVVTGGYSNTASGSYSTVLGGNGNLSSTSYASIIGGGSNTASATYSTVLGGNGNTASASYSIVGGFGSTANGLYNFTFGNSVDPTVTENYRVYFFEPTNDGFFGVNREDLDFPIHVGTNTTNGNGARLTTGGVWTDGSSRTFKDRFATLDSASMLQKVKGLDLRGWFYKKTQEYHISPFAEDFREAFGTGVLDNAESHKYLAALDVAGVALYSSQQLIKQNEQQESRIKELENKNAQLESRLQRLESNTVQQEQPATTTKVNDALARIVAIVPDPASSTVVIKFHTELKTDITLTIVTSSGETIHTALQNVPMNKGDYEVEVGVQDFNSGWYVANLQCSNTTAQRLFRVLH
ncbi:MAG: hypothetical protein K1X91_01770 [Bacteriodetes bacterium]|nr:hypothetical protein [Bacteroidota bacterium]